MWEVLLKINPRLIVNISKKIFDAKLFMVALENGYKIVEKDLQNNRLFCEKDVVMREAIKRNPSFIRYYLGNDKKIIDEAISMGYKPNIKDLTNNPNLNSLSFIKNAVKNGYPEAIVFINHYNHYSGIYSSAEETVLEALEKYQLSLEEIKKKIMQNNNNN